MGDVGPQSRILLHHPAKELKLTLKLMGCSVCLHNSLPGGVMDRGDMDMEGSDLFHRRHIASLSHFHRKYLLN